MRGRSAAALLVALGVLSAGCGRAPEPTAGGGLRIAVSILPQRFVVERIAGDLADVEVLVGPGQSPATYEPTPRQVTALGGADLYIRIGAPFERTLMEKISRAVPDLSVVDGRRGIELEPMEPGSDVGHGHVAGEPDPHFWLDPERLAQHARVVADALSGVDPDHEARYRANDASLRRELEDADRRVAGILAPAHGCAMYVYHPAWGYLARRYGIEQVAVAADGKDPGSRRLAELVERARRDHVRVLFVQPQFRSPTVETMARAIDAEVVTLDPLAENVPANLERMAAEIAAACTP